MNNSSGPALGLISVEEVRLDDLNQMFKGSSSRMTKGLFSAVIHFTAHAGAKGRLS